MVLKLRQLTKRIADAGDRANRARTDQARARAFLELEKLRAERGRLEVDLRARSHPDR